jgi:predicted class III extradiol MEMO1 family dioxygenase
VLGLHLPEGERLRAVPILCGGLSRSLHAGLLPEWDDNVRRFFDALKETTAERGDELIFLLGIDLAHIGRRYGDSEAAIAEQGPLAQVRELDEQRLAQIAMGSLEGYYDLVLPTQDDLRWCGHGPLYTFLASMNGLYDGRVLSYEQWNIDPESVVSFTGMEFRQLI